MIIIISLILSAFFSGMEIAYVSSDKLNLEIQKKQAGFVSNILRRITKEPSKFISTMLIGNNFALVVYGFFMGDFIINYLLINIISEVDKNLVNSVKVFDVYEGQNIPEDKKSIALNVTIQSKEKTLNDEDLEKITELIISSVESKTGAKIRS